jgi:eukaryotic-like serine/threonine-protein kinase
VVDDAPRTLAGRYEVGELIGRGGMAEVHIGHDNRLGRTVAIKILRSDLARDPSFQARFRREAQSAAALNHPAIVAVYDTGEDTMQEAGGGMAHVPFIVMEYVEGHTVRDILRDGNAVPIEEAVEITSGVLSALEYSHHAGIVHRDIKPANVMLTPTGAIKVMDFGIARALADSAATMTQTQAVIGTAQYLSPEQARGESVDARSDLYSTGCLLFELLTGRPPFTGDSPVSVAYQHVREAPASPSDIAPDVPDTLDRITLKALAKERTSRYGSAAEFRSDLEAAVRGGAINAPALGVVAAAASAAQPDMGATQVLGGAIGDAATQTQVAPSWGPVANNRAGAGPVDAPEPEDEKPSHRGLIWTLVVVAVLAIAAITTMLLLDGNKEDPIAQAQVPTLTGMTLEEVRAALTDAGFTEDPTVSHEKNDEVPEGQFVRSDPETGTEVPVDSDIEVWFSQGANVTTVPDVTGLTQAQAIQQIEAAGLVVANEITSTRSGRIAKDSVVGTEPKANESVNAGTEVKLVVSDGFVDLPDVSGATQADAQATLQGLGLAVVINEEESEATPGTVVSQAPAPGAVPQGSSVTIVIAKEVTIEQVQVPNSLVNERREQAERTLRDLGLVPDVREGERSNGIEAGRVEEVNPGQGTPVDVGSTVILYVSNGDNFGTNDGNNGDENGGGNEDDGGNEN